MPESAISISNFFIQKSINENDINVPELTPMKLLKLVYLAHGWYLGFTGNALIGEAVQAWQYGPVVQTVYDEFKRFGKNRITQMRHTAVNNHIVYPLPDEGLNGYLTKIYDTYKNHNGLQLSTITHEIGSPWYQVWIEQGGSKISNAIIPNPIIQRYYSNKLNESR